MKLLPSVVLLLLVIGSPATIAQEPPAAAKPAEAAASEPLPPVTELLKTVEKNVDRDEKALLQYTYHVHSVMEEFDRAEAVKKTNIVDSESFTIGGARIRRVVARDGKPLTADEARKENERVDKEIAKAQKNKAKRDEKAAEAKGRGTLISASRMLELGTFSNERRVMLNGRPAIVLDYAGNHGVKTSNPGEKIVEDLVGTVWIDEVDRVLARVEGHFLADFKLGLGLLLDIHKGLTFTFQQEKVNSEVWLPREITGQGKASAGVFVARVHGRSRTEMSDYRKFRTGVTLLPGSQVIGPDGEPASKPPDTPPPTDPPSGPPK
jgi:hypothetical protein